MTTEEALQIINTSVAEVKNSRREVQRLEKERRDLLVLIDTLQQILGRAESALKDNKEMYDYVFTTSAKWSMNWKPENN